MKIAQQLGQNFPVERNVGEGGKHRLRQLRQVKQARCCNPQIFLVAPLCGEQHQGNHAKADGDQVVEPLERVMANHGEPVVVVEPVLLAKGQVPRGVAWVLRAPFGTREVHPDGNDQRTGGQHPARNWGN